MSSSRRGEWLIRDFSRGLGQPALPFLWFVRRCKTWRDGNSTPSTPYLLRGGQGKAHRGRSSMIRIGTDLNGAAVGGGNPAGDAQSQSAAVNLMTMARVAAEKRLENPRKILG